MDQKNRPISKKIKAIKRWLEKAEQSYDDNAEAKGDLQLLLAQAEMKHLQEQGGNRSKSLFRVGIAVSCFIVIIGGWYYKSQTPPLKEGASWTPLEAGKMVSPVSQSSADWLVKRELTYSKQAPEAEKETNRMTEEPVVVKTGTYATSEIMSQEERQQIVRAAERSLRGK